MFHYYQCQGIKRHSLRDFMDIGLRQIFNRNTSVASFREFCYIVPWNEWVFFCTWFQCQDDNQTRNKVMNLSQRNIKKSLKNPVDQPNHIFHCLGSSSSNFSRNDWFYTPENFVERPDGISRRQQLGRFEHLTWMQNIIRYSVWCPEEIKTNNRQHAPLLAPNKSKWE